MQNHMEITSTDHIGTRNFRSLMKSWNLVMAQPTDAVRSLLEKGGILEKTIRSAQLIGKLKQEETRKSAAKESSKKIEEASSEKASSEN